MYEFGYIVIYSAVMLTISYFIVPKRWRMRKAAIWLTLSMGIVSILTVEAAYLCSVGTNEKDAYITMSIVTPIASTLAESGEFYNGPVMSNPSYTISIALFSTVIWMIIGMGVGWAIDSRRLRQAHSD